MIVNSYRYAGATASPDDYAGLIGWWDADNITGLSHTDPISTWADRSGNGNDMIQPFSASEPLYETGIINGLPAIHFDGTDDLMRLSDTAVANLTGAFSVFMVVRFDTVNKGPAAQNTLLSKNFTAYEFYEYQTSQRAYIGGTGSPVESASSTLAATTDYLLEWHRDGSNNVKAYKNGAEVASGTNSASGSSSNHLHMGMRPSGSSSQYYDGYIAEVFIYDQFRSDAQKTALRDYISGKWGV